MHLVFVGAAATADIASHLRHRGRARRRREAVAGRAHIATGGHRHLANHLLDVQLGAGAALSARPRAGRGRRAPPCSRAPTPRSAPTRVYRRVDLELGAALSRHELNVVLAGRARAARSPAARCWPAAAATSTRASACVHQARDTACDLLWRGLAADRARARPSMAASHPGRRRRQRRAPVEQEPAAVGRRPRSTPSRCWRSTPTRSRPRTARPSAGSTRLPCSTCAAAASRWRRRARC